MKTTNISDERFIELAIEEAGCDITAAGLFASLPARGPQQPATTAPDLGRDALARLVELKRRSMKLTLEALAKTSDLDLAEILAVERGLGPKPEPRVLSKLAQILDLPAKRLLALSGWGAEHDTRLDSAAIKFAARSSAPAEPLSKAESAELTEFVKFLVSQTNEAPKR